MHRRNTIPVYLQIASLLIRDIQARRYLDGDRLPPERALAKQMGTTVTTLRKSLDELENKGFLKRIQGSGNYVQATGTDDSLYSFFRIELKNGGGLPRAELLSCDRLEKPVDFPQFGASQYGFRFRRKRFLNEVLIAAEEIWLDGSYAASVAQEEVLQSLYLYYRKRLGLWIVEAEDRVSLGKYPDWVDFDDELRAGSPCVYIERLSWSQDGAVAEYSRTWFSSNRAKYVARIK